MTTYVICTSKYYRKNNQNAGENVQRIKEFKAGNKLNSDSTSKLVKVYLNEFVNIVENITICISYVFHFTALYTMPITNHTNERPQSKLSIRQFIMRIWIVVTTEMKMSIHKWL